MKCPIKRTRCSVSGAHRHIVAKKTFSWIDSQVWPALWQWAKRRHPHKSARWVKAKYFKTRGDKD
ncbi:MAG: hypothetical protein HKK67_08355 [Chlorobiaceae bacterium]|nr:hypothetical protein [Chlorobiaceae bacterium]